MLFQLVYMVIQEIFLFLSHYCRTTSAMRSDFFRFVQPWNFAILMKDVPRRASCENRNCVCKNTLKRETENLWVSWLTFNWWWHCGQKPQNKYYILKIVLEYTYGLTEPFLSFYVLCLYDFLFMYLIWCAFTLLVLSYFPVVLLNNQ